MTRVAEDRYKITDTGRLMLKDKPLGGLISVVSLSLRPLGSMLAYFHKHGFRSPSVGEQGLWQVAYGCDQSLFQWLKDKPREKEAFHLAMTAFRPETARQWFEQYREKLLTSDRRLLLVDVGGGMGHDARSLLAYHPWMKGRVCVLDLPDVVHDATTHDGIGFVGHDFFNTYPAEVRGAKAYYLRMILHDWPEHQARAILEKVRRAMSKDSVLLINDMVISEENVDLYEARMDWLMMAFVSGLERTEKQWTELLEGAGFLIRSIQNCGSTSLIEAVVS